MPGHNLLVVVVLDLGPAGSHGLAADTPEERAQSHFLRFPGNA